MSKFIVLSPDGFPIRREKTYRKKETALKDLNEWVRNYARQGYYSSVNFGRIPYEDITNYCQIKQF